MEILEILQTILGKYFLAKKNGGSNELTPIFRELVGARNYLAVSKGFSNYLDFKKKFFCIPDSHYQKYLSCRNDFASKFSPQLENSSNSPHFLSKHPPIDIEYPNGIFNFVAKKYPNFNDIKDKITITESDNDAYYRYSKEDNRYFVFIPRTNSNQKISMLIHELSHAITQEKYQHQIPDLYTDEFEAHQIEIELAKDISADFFQAVTREYLMCLVRTEFQISIFENPKLDSTSLYKSCFEKYVGKQNQENTLDYLSDKKIINLPLTDLPVAVALVNLLA